MAFMGKYISNYFFSTNVLGLGTCSDLIPWDDYVLDLKPLSWW